MKIFLPLILALTSSLAMAAPLEVRVMRQTNVAITPVVMLAIDLMPQIARERGLDITVKTLVLPNSNQANEMMINRQLDIMPVALLPFGHIDAAQDGKVKLLSGLTSYQGALVCHGSVKSLADLKDKRIAMQNLGSTQQLMLRQIARQQYGDYFALDRNIVVMPDKISTQFLLAGDATQIQCHCCKAPEQNQLLAANKGLNKLAQANDRDIYAVRVVTYARTEWLDQNPRVAEVWIESVRRAKSQYEKNPLPHVRKWLATDKLEIDAEQFLRDNKDNNQIITTSLEGVDQYLNTLRAMGVVRGRDKTYAEIVWRPELPR